MYHSKIYQEFCVTKRAHKDFILVDIFLKYISGMTSQKGEYMQRQNLLNLFFFKTIIIIVRNPHTVRKIHANRILLHLTIYANCYCCLCNNKIVYEY